MTWALCVECIVAQLMTMALLDVHLGLPEPVPQVTGALVVVLMVAEEMT